MEKKVCSSEMGVTLVHRVLSMIVILVSVEITIKSFTTPDQGSVEEWQYWNGSIGMAVLKMEW